VVVVDDVVPAAAITSSVPVLSRCSPRRSNTVSHAVIAVSGSAAAAAKSRLAGLRPTIRSSTSWTPALLPGREIEPA
jgi:hypothetical protein